MDAGSKVRLPVALDAQQLAERRQALAERRAQEAATLQAAPVHKTWIWLGFAFFGVLLAMLAVVLWTMAQALRLAQENVELSHRLVEALETQAQQATPDYTGGFLVLGGLALVVILLWKGKG